MDRDPFAKWRSYDDPYHQGLGTCRCLRAILVDGTISANGGPGTNYAGGLESGGGSGGQIVIDSGYVRLGSNGGIQAIGGDTLNSGAGGGGRIKMGPTATLVLEEGASSAFHVDGGTASQSNGRGQDGTVSAPNPSVQTSLSDGVLAPADWVHVVVPYSGSGGTGNISHQNSDGNPDDHIRIRLTVHDATPESL